MDGTRRRRRNHRRGVELAKNVLIAVLIFSAVYLTVRSLTYNNLADSAPAGWVGRLWGLLRGDDEAGGPVAAGDAPVIAAWPVRMVLNSGTERFGVQYDAAQAGRIFDEVGGLLGEALAGAKAPRQVGEQAWRDALEQPGIYFDFLGEVPLDTLYAWLGEGDSNPNLGAAARRVLLARRGEDAVALYYSNERDGMYYACETGVAYAGHLEQALEGYGGNSATFAYSFGAEAGYAALDPYVLVFSTAPSPKSYRSANPLVLSGTDQLESLQRALSFRAQSSSVYPIAGGTRVREGKETLEISDTGTITYHAAESGASRYRVDGSGGTGDTQLIEAARKLAAGTVGAYCGAAQLYLIGVGQGQDGAREVRFGYSLDGAAVQLYGADYAAKFTVRDGHITDYTLHFRSYEETGERTPVLPERQAAAALEALDPPGRELVLCYEDSGGELVQAGWVAG